MKHKLFKVSLTRQLTREQLAELEAIATGMIAENEAATRPAVEVGKLSPQERFDAVERGEVAGHIAWKFISRGQKQHGPYAYHITGSGKNRMSKYLGKVKRSVSDEL